MDAPLGRRRDRHGASSSTDLIPTGDFLQFPERCVELADEIVLPPGVVVPHEAL